MLLAYFCIICLPKQSGDVLLTRSGVQKGVRLMDIYEVITIILSAIKLIVELVKLCLVYKKSRPDPDKLDG